MTYGTTRPPYRNSSHRIGRPNVSSPLPSSSHASQCICFGKLRPRRMPVSTSGSASTADLPRCRLRYARYSPFGVCTRSRSPTATPFFFANPDAAGVGCPSGPVAADTGGPVISSSRSRCRSAMPDTRTARRRGVLYASGGASMPSRCASSCRAVTSASCRVSGGNQLAGSSSTPSSIRSSRFMAMLVGSRLQAAGSRRSLASGPVLPAGCSL